MNFKLNYIPVKIRKFIGNNFENISSLQFLKWIKDNIYNVKNSIIFGDPGIGKTRLLDEIEKLEFDNCTTKRLEFNNFNEMFINNLET